jgi:MFS family permease
MQPDRSRRNVVVLAVCQGLMMIGATTMVAEAALVGHLLAPDRTLATLPLALMQLGVMATTIPASLFMGRFGRRAGFSLGALAGFVGAMLCAGGIVTASFALFCLGAFVTGVYTGFGTYYRFAAADGAGEAWRSRAISYVLTGGVLAAVLGPELATATADLLAPHLFAGSFVALGITTLAALGLLQLLEIPPLRLGRDAAPARPLAEIARQPTFVVAAASAMIAYGTMNLLMTVTPLAMVACGHDFHDAARVIQWHALGMFVPSFFTGDLIRRVCALRVMAAGAALLAACVAVALSGLGFWHFWVALVLLGVGWNFLFVGATTLVTETYRPSERAKVQALNDFLVFGTVATTAFVSGALHAVGGWAPVNLVTLPAIAAAAAAAALLWLFRRRRAAVTP